MSQSDPCPLPSGDCLKGLRMYELYTGENEVSVVVICVRVHVCMYTYVGVESRLRVDSQP